MTTPKLSLSRMDESMCMYEYLPLEDQCNLLSWAKRARAELELAAELLEDWSCQYGQEYLALDKYQWTSQSAECRERTKRLLSEFGE